MRRLLYFSVLLFPMFAAAAPICPAGYSLGADGRCAERASLPTGRCPQGYYEQGVDRKCQPRCPYHSEMSLSTEGDYVCQKDNKREWLNEFIQKCRSMGMEYVADIGSCIGQPNKPPLSPATLGRPAQNSGDNALEVCPEGKVGRFRDGVFSCVRGNPEKIAKDMQKKLETEGLTYTEYMKGLKDVQTTRVGAEAMQYRWEEITGERKTEEQRVQEIIDKTVCPDGYKGNAQGGCEPKGSCAEYGCPDGQISSLITDGANKYCQCIAQPVR